MKKIYENGSEDRIFFISINGKDNKASVQHFVTAIFGVSEKGACIFYLQVTVKHSGVRMSS